MQDLGEISLKVIKREIRFLQHIKDKIYLQGEDLSFRLSEFMGFSVFTGETLTIDDILGRVQDVIKRLENLKILIDLEYGEPEMQNTSFVCRVDKVKLNSYFDQIKRELDRRLNPEQNSSPIIDDKGNLRFNNFTMTFTGKELELLKSLIDHLGTLVEKSSLYEKIYSENSAIKVKNHGKTKTFEALDAIFKSLKNKITKNENYKKRLIFAQQDDSFGIFLSKK